MAASLRRSKLLLFQTARTKIASPSISHHYCLLLPDVRDRRPPGGHHRHLRPRRAGRIRCVRERSDEVRYRHHRNSAPLLSQDANALHFGFTKNSWGLQGHTHTYCDQLVRTVVLERARKEVPFARERSLFTISTLFYAYNWSFLRLHSP